MDKNELMTLEFFPSIDIVEDADNYVKLPINELAGLGMAFAQLPQSMRTVKQTFNGLDGVYKAIVPHGTHLAELKDGSGYISTLINKKGIASQARLIPVDKITSHTVTPFNPAMTCAAIMLMNINHKLDTIEESQKKIISTLDTLEHARIKGNIQMLYDTVATAKKRWNDQTFKNDYRTIAIHIKKDAYQDIEKYKERIDLLLNKKDSFHLSNETTKLGKEILDYFNYYRLSIFMYCYATFVETMLGTNYDSSVLSDIMNTFYSMSAIYKEKYTYAYNLLEKNAKNSIDMQMLKGFGDVSQNLGKAIAKVSVLSKGPIDEALISLGKGAHSLQKDSVDSTLKQLRQLKDVNIEVFISQLKKMDLLYNNDMNIMIDNDHVYIEKKLLDF